MVNTVRHFNLCLFLQMKLSENKICWMDNCSQLLSLLFWPTIKWKWKLKSWTFYLFVAMSCTHVGSPRSLHCFGEKCNLINDKFLFASNVQFYLLVLTSQWGNGSVISQAPSAISHQPSDLSLIVMVTVATKFHSSLSTS